MSTEPLFEVVTEYVTLEKHVHHLEEAKVLGFDTETTGLDPVQDRLRLVQIAMRDYPTLLFDMLQLDEPTQSFLRELLCGHAVKVFQNAKFDMKFLYQAGLPVSGRVFDTYIAARLLRQKTGLTKFGLDTLAQHYLSVDLPKHEQTSDWTGDLSQAQYMYAARDAAILLPLRDAMIRELQFEDMTDVAKLEFGCLYAVVEMELTGIQLDLERWQRLGKQLERQKEEVSIELKRHLRKPVIQLSLFGEDTEVLNLDSHHRFSKH